MRKFILIAITLLLYIASPAWGANTVCYVDAAGSNTSPYETWAKAANLPSTVLTYLHAAGHDPTTGHIIFIAPGTYSDNLYVQHARLNGSLWQGTANNTCADTAACLLAKATKGQVEIANSNAGVNGFRWATATTGTVQNISISSSTATYNCFLASSGSVTLNDVRLHDCAAYGLLIAAAAVTVTANRLVIEGAVGGINNSTTDVLTCNYCIISDSLTKTLTGVAVYQAGTGTTTLNNNIVNNFSNSPPYCNAGVFNINNSILGPSFVADGYTFTRNAGTANLLNNILIPNYFSAHNLISGVLNTDTGNIRTDQPRFVHRKRGGIIVPSFDDSGNAAYVYSLIDTFKTRGKNGTYYVHGSTLAANITNITNIYNDGTIKLGSHSWSHSDLTATTAFTVTKASSTIDINRTTDTITVGPTTGFPVGAVTLTPFKSLTLTAIRTWLNDTAGVTNGAMTLGVSTYGESLDTVVAQSINAAYTLPLLLDTTLAGGFFKSELADFKTTLEATFSGLTVKSFASPGGVNSANIGKATKVAGFLGGRVNYAVAGATTLLSSIDVDSTSYYMISTFITDASATDAEIRTRTRAFCEWVAQSGRIIYLLAHSAAECTAAQWGIILDTIAEYPDIEVLDSDAALTKIRTGGLWANGSGDCNDAGATTTCTWTRTWTDLSDFHLQAGSPAINAGVDVGLTEDYEGKPIPTTGAVDIGAYQHGHLGHGMTPGMGMAP